MAGGLLLIAAALFLTGYNIWDERRALASSQGILLEMPAEIRYPLPATREGEDGELEIPDYILNPYMDMPTVEIEGREYIGVLEIPALDLELPVMSGWSYPDLKIAPCRYSGSVYQGNIVIAAHNYKRHFGELKSLKGGERVVFTDAAGNVFHYEVACLETLMPTAIEEMESGEWDLSLFTCTVGGSYRVTVRCELVTEAQGEETAKAAP